VIAATKRSAPPFVSRGAPVVNFFEDSNNDDYIPCVWGFYPIDSTVQSDLTRDSVTAQPLVEPSHRHDCTTIPPVVTERSTPCQSPRPSPPHATTPGPRAVHLTTSGPSAAHLTTPGPRAVHSTPPGPSAVSGSNATNVVSGSSAVQVTASGPSAVHFTKSGPRAAHPTSLGPSDDHLTTSGPCATHLTTYGPRAAQPTSPGPSADLTTTSTDLDDRARLPPSSPTSHHRRTPTSPTPSDSEINPSAFLA